MMDLFYCNSVDANCFFFCWCCVSLDYVSLLTILNFTDVLSIIYSWLEPLMPGLSKNNIIGSQFDHLQYLFPSPGKSFFIFNAQNQGILTLLLSTDLLLVLCSANNLDFATFFPYRYLILTNKLTGYKIIGSLIIFKSLCCKFIWITTYLNRQLKQYSSLNSV